MLLIYLGLLVLLTTVFCELAAKRGWLPYWVSRKILHVVAVGSCAVAGYFSDALGLHKTLILIVAVAEVGLIALISFGGLMREESGRKAWGIIWFPLSFLIILLLTDEAEVIGFSMAVLAICDPAATIAGKLFSRPVSDSPLLDDALAKADTKDPFPPYVYQLTGDAKSIPGNVAFVLSFMLLIIAKFVYFFEYFDEFDLLGADVDILFLFFAFALIVAAGEALGSKGLDNLIVPLLTFTLLEIDFFGPDSLLTMALVMGCAPIFVYFTVRRGSLSLGGALTASLLGTLIALSAGPVWLIPLLLFFGSSSLIGKFFPAHSAAGDAKQKLPRDATQVLANGAIYCLLAVVGRNLMVESEMIIEYHDGPFLLLTAAAVATADTWSSELGQYFRRPTYDLVKLKRVPSGLSGGVSLPGTIVGLGGAALIADLGFWLLPNPSVTNLLFITAFGFAGMLLDSVLGSLLQATYRDPATGALSDVCPENGELVSGFSWMTNDLVNFLAILITVYLAFLFTIL